MQVVALKVPVPLLVQETVPVGVIAVPAAVSATVAVQVLGWFTITVGGEQFMVVVVVRRFTVMAVFPELVAWVASPP